MNFEP